MIGITVQRSPKAKAAATDNAVTAKNARRLVFSLIGVSLPVPNFMENIGISLTSKAHSNTVSNGMNAMLPHHEARMPPGVTLTYAASEPQSIAAAGVGKPRKLSC